MCHDLISLNQDLKKLRNEGYSLELKGNHLLVHRIPYVNTNKEIAFGTLVSPLDLAGDLTVKPSNHVVYFMGEHPCDKDGNVLQGIAHSNEPQNLTAEIRIDCSFSNKPDGGYCDYHEKITRYANIIESHAQAIDRSVTAKNFMVVESISDDSVFNYPDTNSSRAEIDAISVKLQNLKIAIVGVGGTGSYVLDFVAKTPVREIHLFDDDIFLSHNAFRAPGAASLDALRKQPKKVAHLCDIYSNMHKYVIPHEYHITEAAIDDLSCMNFVFICIDEDNAKRTIIQGLVEKNIPFVDVGIGINVIDGKLDGGIRVTAVTVNKNDHLKQRISFDESGENNDYNQNVQIAELNALNAALAVIKWKKLSGFYHDLQGEHNASYDISTNKIFNDETIL